MLLILDVFLVLQEVKSYALYVSDSIFPFMSFWITSLVIATTDVSKTNFIPNKTVISRQDYTRDGINHTARTFVIAHKIVSIIIFIPFITIYKLKQ